MLVPFPVTRREVRGGGPGIRDRAEGAGAAARGRPGSVPPGPAELSASYGLGGMKRRLPTVNQASLRGDGFE